MRLGEDLTTLVVGDVKVLIRLGFDEYQQLGDEVKDWPELAMDQIPHVKKKLVNLVVRVENLVDEEGNAIKDLTEDNIGRLPYHFVRMLWLQVLDVGEVVASFTGGAGQT